MLFARELALQIVESSRSGRIRVFFCCVVAEPLEQLILFFEAWRVFHFAEELVLVCCV